MSTLEEIAMRESPLMRAIKREQEAAPSFADAFLRARYAPLMEPSPQWLVTLQKRVDDELILAGENFGRLLLGPASEPPQARAPVRVR